MMKPPITVDYIVIGSGIAGLSAARVLAQTGKTLVVTKGAIREGSTHYAQGGIAVAMAPSDTTAHHVADTLKAGDGLCDLAAVQVLVEEGPARVRELIALGADFDRDGDSYAYTREAAHGQRRILHAGDATGKEIEKTLGRAALGEKNLQFLANTSVIRLLCEDGRCVGCEVLSEGEVFQIFARAVIVASGGCGQIYAYNTNPPVATGDGIALAYMAGAEVQDMEFFQFHPTTLYLGDKKPISLFLISEAVRGEGAVLRDMQGDRFMLKYHSDAELAPRDVVSRSIFHRMHETETPHVFLDLSPCPGDVAKRFPTIAQRCLSAGIDIRRDFVPVAPAAHYFMGGISTDLWGRTTVPGLYAAGEVASLGIHGANRLASNSLLDGLVFGHRAATAAASEAPPRFHRDIPLVETLDAHASVSSSSCLAAKAEIRDVMWRCAGIVRSRQGLLQAQQVLSGLSWATSLPPYLSLTHELRSMWYVADLVVSFALAREESRGGHYREDFPKRDDVQWARHLRQRI